MRFDMPAWQSRRSWRASGQPERQVGHVAAFGLWLLAWLGPLVATLLLASLLIYALTVLAPGDPALALFRARYGEQAQPISEQIGEIRREAGFDRPLWEQYGTWLGRALQGDLGQSFTSRRPVAPLVAERLPTTLMLAFGALGLAIALSIPAGVLAARHRGATSLTLGATQLGISVPDYFVALALVLLFAVKLGMLPVAGWGSPAAFVLPALTLALGPWASFTRLLLAGVDEAMRSDWARTGRAKGLTEQTLLFRHALPLAYLPVVSRIGVNASEALATGLVVEVIFAIPGIGRLLYDAVGERDIPTVQACLLIQVSLAVLASSVADAALRWLNPTLRRGSGVAG